MIYKEAYDRLKTEIQFALTDYEELSDKVQEKIIPLRRLYYAIVDIINDSEGWELEYEEDWHKRVYGGKK